MNGNEIEALVRRWATEGVAAGREEVWDELLDADVRDVSGQVEAVGRESFKARARAIGAALADRSVSIDDLVIAGDHVAWRWTVRGVHVGAFLDVPPTGKRVTLRGANFQRVRAGRVVEHWTVADLLGLARQLREMST